MGVQGITIYHVKSHLQVLDFLCQLYVSVQVRVTFVVSVLRVFIKKFEHVREVASDRHLCSPSLYLFRMEKPDVDGRGFSDPY